MIRFEQTRDVLAHAKEFHYRISKCYRQLEKKADKKKVKLLLKYMMDREDELAAALDDFVEEATKSALNTWFQYTRDDKILCAAQCPDPEEIKADMSVEDVLKIAAKFHKCLMSLYEEIARNAEPDEVKEIFTNLQTQGEKKWKKLSRNVGLLMDL